MSAAGAQEVSVGFESSLRVPTLMHVISNAETNMMETCEKYNAATASLGDIAKLLDSKYARKRLQSSCFAGRIGEDFHKHSDLLAPPSVSNKKMG